MARSVENGAVPPWASSSRPPGLRAFLGGPKKTSVHLLIPPVKSGPHPLDAIRMCSRYVVALALIYSQVE